MVRRMRHRGFHKRRAVRPADGTCIVPGDIPTAAGRRGQRRGASLSVGSHPSQASRACLHPARSPLSPLIRCDLCWPTAISSARFWWDTRARLTAPCSRRTASSSSRRRTIRRHASGVRTQTRRSWPSCQRAHDVFFAVRARTRETFRRTISKLSSRDGTRWATAILSHWSDRSVVQQSPPSSAQSARTAVRSEPAARPAAGSAPSHSRQPQSC